MSKPMEQRRQPGYYPGFSTVAQQKFWDAATRKVVLDRLQPPPALRFFNLQEAATMEAVVDRVLPQDDRTSDRRIAILPTIDERLHSNHIEGYRYEDMPSDQEAYRIGARSFEQMAHALHDRAFAQLAVLEQEQILESVHRGEPSAAQEAWKGVNIHRFWILLVSDCCSAYYSHPWAWDEIGYGGPAYPRAYMRLEDGEPEPWEVNEARYEWSDPPDTLSGRSQEAHATNAHQSNPGQGGTH